MLDTISQENAAKILRKLSYLKIDIATFLIITKKDTSASNKASYVQKYGDSVYLPSPESLMGELSTTSQFLQYRNMRREEAGSATDDPMFNKNVAFDFVVALMEKVGLPTELDHKNLYIPKNAVATLRNHTVKDFADLYSHITVAGMGGIRKQTSDKWGH